jgi:hypothetical protein
VGEESPETQYEWAVGLSSLPTKVASPVMLLWGLLGLLRLRGTGATQAAGGLKRGGITAGKPVLAADTSFRPASNQSVPGVIPLATSTASIEQDEPRLHNTHTCSSSPSPSSWHLPRSALPTLGVDHVRDGMDGTAPNSTATGALPFSHDSNNILYRTASARSHEQSSLPRITITTVYMHVHVRTTTMYVPATIPPNLETSWHCPSNKETNGAATLSLSLYRGARHELTFNPSLGPSCKRMTLLLLRLCTPKLSRTGVVRITCS